MSALPFRRMECDPGQGAHVDFGSGAPIVTPEGKHRRTHVFRIVLTLMDSFLPVILIADPCRKRLAPLMADGRYWMLEKSVTPAAGAEAVFVRQPTFHLTCALLML